MLEDHPHVLRKALNEAEGLLRPETKAWLAQLPPDLAPKALALQSPRIANRIASLWGKPLQCEGYLDELLFNDHRTDNRQGFPPNVGLEIMQLKSIMLDRFEERRLAADSQEADVWNGIL